MSDILAGIVAAKHCPAGHKWHEIGDIYQLNSTTARGKYLHRDKAKYPKGVLPGDCPICDDGGLDYAGAVEVMGLAPTCGTGCGAMIFEPGGGVTFFENLETAAKFLRFLNGD